MKIKHKTFLDENYKNYDIMSYLISIIFLSLVVIFLFFIFNKTTSSTKKIKDIYF